MELGLEVLEIVREVANALQFLLEVPWTRHVLPRKPQHVQCHTSEVSSKDCQLWPWLFEVHPHLKSS